MLCLASQLAPPHYAFQCIAIGYKKHLLTAATPYASELRTQNQNLKKKKPNKQNLTRQRPWFYKGTEIKIFEVNFMFYLMKALYHLKGKELSKR